MKKIFLTKKGMRMIPADGMSEKKVQEMKEGVIYSCEMKQPRNIKHHNLIFGLAQLAVTHSPEDSLWHVSDPSLVEHASYEFIKAVMFDAGLTVKKRKLDGTFYEEPQSISFESMDEERFEPVSDLIFRHVARILCINEEYLRKNYEEMLESF